MAKKSSRVNLFKINVKILPRNEVLDVQGRTIQESLEEQGVSLTSCRVGKYLQLELEGENSKDALKKAQNIAKVVLYNPLIETCEVEVASPSEIKS